MDNKPSIFGLSKTALQNGLVKLGLPKFKAQQIWRQVYVRGISDPQQMTDLGKEERDTIAENLDFTLPEISSEQFSEDGVIKWLFKWADGQETEAVYIPETAKNGKHRGTLCVSSQVGCTMTCRFCHTGTQALARNLTAAEIVAQVFYAKQHLLDFRGKDAPREVTNVVFMGQGEPLFNKDHVFNAINILMDVHGLAFGTRKITLSTSGVVPEIVNVGKELGCNLAISLHATNDETREKIMPINKKWPLSALLNEIHKFALKEHRRITWEYVMLDGVNDSDAEAHELIELIEDIPSFVNLIPFNPWPGSPYNSSSTERIRAFGRILRDAGVDVAIRRSRGDDISAACGQLRTETSGRNTVSTQFPTVVKQYGDDKQKQKVVIEDVAE